MMLFFVGFRGFYGVIWVGRTLTSQPLPIDPIRTYGAHAPPHGSYHKLCAPSLFAGI